MIKSSTDPVSHKPQGRPRNEQSWKADVQHLKFTIDLGSEECVNHKPLFYLKSKVQGVKQLPKEPSQWQLQTTCPEWIQVAWLA